MSRTPPAEDRVLDVWNRAAAFELVGARQGDRALADALRLHGMVEADGMLAAVEADHEEERSGTSSFALQWLGLTEVAALVAEVLDRWSDLTHDGEPGEPGEGRAALDEDARQQALDALEVEADERWAALEVGDALDAALRHALTVRPEHFAVTTSAEKVADAPPAPTGWGVEISEDEKARRLVQAFEAFGIRAELDRGAFSHWPPEEPGAWELVDELNRLLELRYPTQDE